MATLVLAVITGTLVCTLTYLLLFRHAHQRSTVQWEPRRWINREWTDQENGHARNPAPSAPRRTDTEHILWGNMACINTVIRTRDAINDNTIIFNCVREMESYIMSEGLAIKDNTGAMSNLYSREKSEGVPCTYGLGKGLFFAIPWTSAWSENIFTWLCVSSQLRGNTLAIRSHLESCLKRDYAPTLQALHPLNRKWREYIVTIVMRHSGS